MSGSRFRSCTGSKLLSTSVQYLYFVRSWSFFFFCRHLMASYILILPFLMIICHVAYIIFLVKHWSWEKIQFEQSISISAIAFESIVTIRCTGKSDQMKPACRNCNVESSLELSIEWVVSSCNRPNNCLSVTINNNNNNKGNRNTNNDERSADIGAMPTLGEISGEYLRTWI